MDDKDGAQQDQLEKHSLPGTNQAGKVRVSPEEHDQENRPGTGETQQPNELEKHSLPGTNQAGNARVSHEEND